MKYIKYFLSFLFSLFVLFLTAQENDPGWLWAEQGGSASGFSNSTPLYDYGEERIVDLAIDNDNNYYYLAQIAGYNFMIGDMEFDTYNDYADERDILVFTTNEEVKYRLSKTIGWGVSDRAISINIDGDSNIYVSGNVMNLKGDTQVHFDTDTIMPESASISDLGPQHKAAFIVKYDSQGEYQWLEMPGDDESYAIGNYFYGNANIVKSIIEENGSIHNLIWFKPGNHFDGELIVEEGEFVAAIVKYDSDGELIDFITIDMTPFTVFYNYQLVYNPNLDRYYIADTRRSGNAGILGIGDYGSDDNGFYLAAVDNRGEVLWFHENLTLNTYAARDLQLDAQGNIYFSGKFANEDSFAGFAFEAEGTGSGTKNPFLLKLDAEGNLIWGSNALLYSPYPGNSIVIKGEDVFVGLGSLQNTWDDVSIPGPILAGLTPSIGILRFDAETGEIQEVIQDMFTPSSDAITAMALDQNGDLVVGGYFGSDLFYDTDFHLHNNGADSDFFVAKYRPHESACIPPKTIHLQKTGDTEVKIYWSPRQEETQLEVAYSNTPQNYPSKPWPNFNPSTDGTHVEVNETPELVLTDVSTGTTSKYYQVFVRPICGDNIGSWSAPIFFKLEDLSFEDCLAPRFIQLDDVDENSAEISWSPVGDETQWKVSYDIIYQGAQEEVQSILVNGSPQVTLENLIPEI